MQWGHIVQQDLLDILEVDVEHMLPLHVRLRLAPGCEIENLAIKLYVTPVQSR